MEAAHGTSHEAERGRSRCWRSMWWAQWVLDGARGPQQVLGLHRQPGLQLPWLGKEQGTKDIFLYCQGFGTVGAGPVLGHCLVRALRHRNPMASPLRRSQQLSRQLPGAASPTPEPQNPSPPQPRSFPTPSRGPSAGVTLLEAFLLPGAAPRHGHAALREAAHISTLPATRFEGDRQHTESREAAPAGAEQGVFYLYGQNHHHLPAAAVLSSGAINTPPSSVGSGSEGGFAAETSALMCTRTGCFTETSIPSGLPQGEGRKSLRP